MLKILIILFIGLVFESTGIVLLKKGMTTVGEVKMTSAREIFRVVKTSVTNVKILGGVFFEALFFVCLLIMMAKSDISFIWPLTGLSFVFSTFAAIWFLGETVSAMRWAGVLMIVVGSVVIGYSEQSKEKSAAPSETKSTVQ
ncbi:MAG TPA: EamA family transporter [Verrucomicrobiae bacterium]|jgi:drug/metabolite transporter (DMT)-like permease